MIGNAAVIYVLMLLLAHAEFDEDYCKGSCRPWDNLMVASTMPFSPYMIDRGHFQLPVNVRCIPPELVARLCIASLDFCLTMFDLFLFLQANPYVVIF